MRIIAKRTLMEAAAAHGDCVEQARQWYEAARRATWQNLAEVRVTFPHADAVEGLTVFNIKGNHYRLIVHLRYDIQIIFIKGLLTHAEYDRGGWKND